MSANEPYVGVIRRTSDAEEAVPIASPSTLPPVEVQLPSQPSHNISLIADEVLPLEEIPLPPDEIPLPSSEGASPSSKLNVHEKEETDSGDACPGENDSLSSLSSEFVMEIDESATFLREYNPNEKGSTDELSVDYDTSEHDGEYIGQNNDIESAKQKNLNVVGDKDASNKSVGHEDITDDDISDDDNSNSDPMSYEDITNKPATTKNFADALSCRTSNEGNNHCKDDKVCNDNSAICRRCDKYSGNDEKLCNVGHSCNCNNEAATSATTSTGSFSVTTTNMSTNDLNQSTTTTTNQATEKTEKSNNEIDTPTRAVTEEGPSGEAPLSGSLDANVSPRSRIHLNYDNDDVLDPLVIVMESEDGINNRVLMHNAAILLPPVMPIDGLNRPAVATLAVHGNGEQNHHNDSSVPLAAPENVLDDSDEEFDIVPPQNLLEHQGEDWMAVFARPRHRPYIPGRRNHAVPGTLCSSAPTNLDEYK
ncbi:hypothetical protein ACJJTC_001000 [Scirpophaga incertulas]